MAKFLFFIQPAIGHVNPTLPISRKLVEQGHQVTWIAGKVFKHEVEKTGAVYFPQPAAMDWGEQPLYEFFPELAKLKGLKQVLWYIQHTFEFVPLHLQAIDAVLEHFQANVIVGDPITFGVYTKSELSRIPCAMISMVPLALPSRDTAPFGLGLLPGKGLIAKTRNRLLNHLIYSVILKDIKARFIGIRRQMGLPPPASFSRYIFEISSLVLQLTTPAFEYPRNDQPKSIHFVGPVMPESDPAFSPPEWWPDLMADRPVVLINQGTIAVGLERLIEPTVEGLKQDNLLVIAVPVHSSMAQTVPANVRTANFIPFTHLLPHVDVMVTNGGYGGTQLALAHGVPLVVAGATEDKMEVAARVEWSGAGINLRQSRPSASSIKKAVQEVLHNPIYRQNAQRIQRDFAQYNAPKLAAELLESLANEQEEFVQR